jgi:hypothetical protein
MTVDPDRYDPSRDQAASGPLDPAADPDRYRSPTLPGLLGEGAHEDERSNLTWLIGLVAVFSFLILVSVLASFGNPR